MTKQPLCPTGKVPHAARELARRAARGLQRRVNQEGKIFQSAYGYECVCGFWHITRRDWSGVLLYEAPSEELQRWAMGGAGE